MRRSGGRHTGIDSGTTLGFLVELFLGGGRRYISQGVDDWVFHIFLLAPSGYGTASQGLCLGHDQ